MLQFEELVALLDNSFHVGAGGADDAAGYLEAVFVFDLNIIPARILDILLLLVQLEHLLLLWAAGEGVGLRVQRFYYVLVLRLLG